MSIIKAVENSISSVSKDFQAHPTHYYTENDLVCAVYHEFLGKIGNPMVMDAEGAETNIVHMEYPTPFRCDMEGSKFELKSENDRKRGRTKFRRGHIDMAILNPLVVRELTSRDVMFQDYEVAKPRIFPRVSSTRPMILYAVEFQYHRDDMSYDAGFKFMEKTLQDHKKLAASNNPVPKHLGCPAFVGNFKSIAFFHDTSQLSTLRRMTELYNEIVLCHPIL